MEEEVKTQSQVVVGAIIPAKQDTKDAEQSGKKVIPIKKLKTTIRSGRFAVENRARASFTNEHQSPDCQEAGDE